MYTGESLTSVYKVENLGNTEAQVELVVETDDGLVGSIDGTVGSKNITVAPGSQVINIKFEHDESFKPGSFDYTITANIPSEVPDEKVQVFQAKGTIAVEGVSVTIVASNNKYTLKDKDLIYTLSIDNKGTVPVEYDITLVGLPEGSYEVEDNLMVPGGQRTTVSIILFKDAIPNIEPAIMGLR